MVKRILKMLCLLMIIILVGCANNRNENVETTEAVEDEKLYGNVKFITEEGEEVMNIDDITDVKVETTQNSEGNTEFIVRLKFTDEGSEKFKNITTEQIGKKLSVYVDDELVLSPTIQTAITSGDCVINNFDNQSDAYELVAKIKGDPNSIKDSDTAKQAEQDAKDNRIKLTLNDGTVLVNASHMAYITQDTTQTGKGGSDEYRVTIVMNDDGKNVLSEETGKHVGDELNLVVNGSLLWEGKVEGKIDNGELSFMHIESSQEAMEFSSVLQNALNDN